MWDRLTLWREDIIDCQPTLTFTATSSKAEMYQHRPRPGMQARLVEYQAMQTLRKPTWHAIVRLFAFVALSISRPTSLTDTNKSAHSSGVRSAKRLTSRLGTTSTSVFMMEHQGIISLSIRFMMVLGSLDEKWSAHTIVDNGLQVDNAKAQF